MDIEGCNGGRGGAITVNDGTDEDGHGGGRAEVWVEDEGEGGRGVEEEVEEEVEENTEEEVEVEEDVGEDVSGREEEVEMNE